MHIWTTSKLLLGLLVLESCSVESSLKEACPLKDPPPGVQVLVSGSEVTLSCDGRISVNGVDLPQVGRNGKDTVTRTSRSGGHVSTTSGVGSPVTAAVKEYEGKGRSVATVSLPGSTDSQDSFTYAGGRVGTTHEERGDQLNGGASESEAEKDPSFQEGAVEMANVTGLERAPGAAGRVVRGLKGWVEWTWNGRPMLTDGNQGDTLQLASLQLSNSGNYICYQGGKLAFSVKITVVSPLEQPTLSCYRRTPTSKIRCDWTSSKPITPTPECYLLLKRGFWGTVLREPCSYSVARARCWCVLGQHHDGTRDSYRASLCVTNIAGNLTSPSIDLHPKDIVKPDPPHNVSVRAEEGKAHRLIVTWKYPRSWRANFYKLKFQLQYAPVLPGGAGEKFQLQYAPVLPGGAGELQEVVTARVTHEIRDATSRLQYVLRVRAREEFDMGSWSDWSPLLYAYSWIAPTPDPAIDMDLSDTLPFEGSGMTGMADLTVTSCPGLPDLDSQMSVLVSWVLGACLLLTFMVLFAIFLRQRKEFIQKLHKLSHSVTSRTPTPPSSQLPKEEGNPLVSTPGLPEPSLNQESPCLQEEPETGEGIHLNNIGYFLVQRD